MMVAGWITSAFVAGCASPGAGSDGADGGNVGPDLAWEPGPGDSLPVGAISFVHAGTCPEGWAPFMNGEGRFVVPTVGNNPPGSTSGPPLTNHEDRTHVHAVQATVTLRDTQYAGMAAESNHGVAENQSVVIDAVTDAVSSGIPYVQLRICKKMAAPKAYPRALPRGMLLFFDGGICPDGFVQAAEPQGRFIVALPPGGEPGAIFGGGLLGVSEDRPHAHNAQGALMTMPYGIALPSGCCASGYAANDTYAFTTRSSLSAVEQPYIQLLQCQKQ